MATFNKRGYKAPKEKAEKVEETFIEDVNVDEKTVLQLKHSIP